MTQNCSDRIKNLFQLDMDQESSWYILTPGIVHQDKPAKFGPQDINPVASHTFTGSQETGMYTRKELKVFGIAFLSMPLQERHLKSSHKISFSTPPLKKEQTVLTIIPHEPSFLWIRWFRLGILKINSWIHLGLSFMYLSLEEFISRSFCSSSL